MVDAYAVPTRIHLARRILRPIFRLVFHVLSRVRIIGLENVPKSGAYLIAFNHVSIVDPPLVTAFWPVAPEVMGAAEVWQRPGQSLLARWYGGIPVHRDQYDRQLIDTALSVLRSGYPLLIAPEGERSHKPGMQPAHRGVAFLMNKANVPVIPVGVAGGTEDFLDRALKGQRPEIEMRIGPPIVFSSADKSLISLRETRQQNTDAVMTQIAALLPPAYRGYYASYVGEYRETD